MKTPFAINRPQVLPASHVMTAGAYNLAIGGLLGWGFLLNWLMVQTIPVQSIAQAGPYGLLIAFVASTFLGSYLVNKTESPTISFLGYNLIVLPFGLALTLAAATYDPLVVSDALKLTGVVTGIMMTLGSMYPAAFARAQGAITVALLASIVIEIVGSVFMGRTYPIIDYVVVACFCGYIGYDWARANAVPKTLGNAIISSASLYMDITNLFLRIMRILGRRR